MKKRGHNEENLKKGKKFSSEYQPLPEAKKNGRQKKRAIKDIAECISNGNLPEAMKKAVEVWNLPNETIMDGLFIKLLSLAFSKNAKSKDVENAIRVIAEYSGQAPAIKYAQTDSAGNDINTPIVSNADLLEIMKRRQDDRARASKSSD